MNYSIVLRRRVTLAAFSLALLSPAFGQTPGTGAIRGRVLDPAGLPVANAHVLLTNESTKTSRTDDTTSEGSFAASLLAPGDYSITVEQPGLEEKGTHTVLVTVGETSFLSITLAVAHVGVNIEVDANAELMQTQSATLGRSVDNRAIQSLPLANRNFTQLLSLSPGVIVALPDATTLGRNTQNVAAVGNKTTANSFQFNGIDANNLAQNSAKGNGDEVGLAVPAPDTIQEFKVQTANYDAGYGRSTGANVDLVSKTGTDKFHGSVWEFFRNDVLNANLFFLKLDGQPRPVLSQNLFGGTIGGPVLRKKLFFFAAYQGLRSSNGVSPSSISTLFLPALTADRSAATLGAQFCSSGPTFAGGTQLACNGSNINPVALKLLNLKLPSGQFAVPNPQVLLPLTPGQTPIGESTFSIPSSYREDQYTVNLDATISPKDQMLARFFYSNAPTVQPFASANVPGWTGNELDKNAMLVLGYTRIFSPSMVNLARFGYTRFDGYSSIASPFSAADIGTESPEGVSTPGTPMPGITVAGLFTVGNGGTPFQASVTNSFVWQDTVSITRGRNSLRAGVEAKHHQVTVDPPFLISGFMETQTFNDFLIGQSAAQNGSPDGLSNIEISGANSGDFRKDERYNDFAAFAQDDIRLSSRLAVFAGLRYEIFGAPAEKNGRLATFDPSIASLTAPSSGTYSGFVVPSNFPGSAPIGVTRLNRDGLWANDYGDVSPRLGFAMQLTDRPTILLRGGYGIYFDRLSAGLVENLVNQPPFAQTQVLFDAQAGASSEQRPFSPLLPPASAYPLFVPRTPGGAQTLYPVDPNITDPYTQEYNLNVQASLARDFLLEAGYVGTRSLHIPGGVEFNQALLASPQHPINGEVTNTAANITNRLPYAGVSTGSIVYQTRFPAQYNGLLASVTKRLSHGLQFLASYTWSRSLDDTSGTGGSDVYEEWLLSNDQNNPRQAYGPTDFDRTNRAVLSLVYQVPVAAAVSRSTAHVFDDWKLSAIAVAQSGSPLTITDSNAGLVYGNFENRAQRPTSNPMTSGSLFTRVQGTYLSAAAFPSAPLAPYGVSPSDTDFGDSSTGFLRGPGQRNVDLAAERSFRITEALHFNFRAEFFNLTNTSNFSNPNTSLSSGQAFGTISSTATNPRIIQFAGKILF
jgi:hypothetical protein